MNVGLMLVRNEIDVLQEALRHHCEHFRYIVCQDGSTDGGTQLLSDCPNVIKLFRDEDYLKPGERFCDAHRNIGLKWIRREFGPNTWITLLHADEFWYDDPISAAEEADRKRKTYVLWAEFRFFLHESDRGKPKRPGMPIWQRIRYYCGPFFEIRQFYLATHHTYIPGEDHRTLPGPLPQCRENRLERVPRYCHYPYRSIEQVRKCYKDKCESRYWQPDHEWLKDRMDDPFVRFLPPPRNSPLAHWWRVGWFSGRLPEAEPFLPADWDG